MVTMLRRRPRRWICDVVRAVASSRRGDVTLASHDGHALDRHVWTMAWPADRPDVAARCRDVTHDWRIEFLFVLFTQLALASLLYS